MYKTLRFLFAWIISGFSLTLHARETAFTEPANPESCTSIMVGKKASTDGSVITSHTCDGNYRTWMNLVAGQTYERDTTTGIYHGLLHTEFVKDETRVKLKGSIPQTHTTYRYLNTAYPCLNEKQLGIGETTISGRRELVNPEGMFMIEELEKIVLQRCSTARQAIRLMDELIRRYGYADWGECLTIADPGEVWHFEVFGEGPDRIGGVWAAVRIPDEQVGVSANIPRIAALNPKDTAHCMASANVFDVARKLGYWDGKEPFCFWKAYGGGKKAFGIREYFVLTRLAPSLNLSFEAEELPLTVRPEKPVDVTDVMALLRQTYQGTPWDMTQNLEGPSANPWMTTDMVNMLNAIRENTVERYRLIAVPQCSYSHVIQLRDWLPDEVGGIAWMSFDNPGQSPRFPIFCGNTRLPACFEVCGQHRYREDAAIWTYRRTNKLATVRWGQTKDAIAGAVAHFETKGQTELPFVESRYRKLYREEGAEKAGEYLTNYTSDFAGATLLRWKEMGDSFWSLFARGF
ncbi:MAG: C69 family dipeptidase [Tannerellaceae bacterium]|jgi:dipeptidase|nr:C69 family dipeptidase [Tannerellaceae bacterium]